MVINICILIIAAPQLVVWVIVATLAHKTKTGFNLTPHLLSFIKGYRAIDVMLISLRELVVKEWVHSLFCLLTCSRHIWLLWWTRPKPTMGHFDTEKSSEFATKLLYHLRNVGPRPAWLPSSTNPGVFPNNKWGRISFYIYLNSRVYRETLL